MVDEPETLGSYLKNQRESKKISLRELAKNTKVREHILRAIEEDRHELLPPSTYVRGFLSAYAKYLRLDENEVLLRYERVLKGEPVASPRVEPAKPKEKVIPIEPPKPKEEISAPPPPKPKQKISAVQPSKRKKQILWNTKPTWVVAGVIAASLILLYFFSPYSSKPPEPVPEKPVPEKATVDEGPTAPAPPLAAVTAVPKEKPVIPGKEPLTPSSPVASTTSVPEKKPLSLQLKAVEETWVSLEVDGQSGRGMTLKPGEGISVQASNRIRMILGNAGGLDLILNGKILEKFGKSGEVLTLIFTSNGVEVKPPEKPNPSKE
jgi:cytoskeleton protein RodZ